MHESLSTCNANQANVSLTAAAIQHLDRQIKKQGHGIGMRLGVKKYGCSGFAYVTDLIDKTAPDDTLFQVAPHLVIAVSPKDLPILQGTQIDYIREGMSQKFKFSNPNETGSCGCGESFSVK